MFAGVRSFLRQLEASGNLVHFGEGLSTDREIAAASRYISEHLRETQSSLRLRLRYPAVTDFYKFFRLKSVEHLSHPLQN